VAQFIADELRSDILMGVIPSGTPLPIDQLASRFGTSAIPVREALRALEAEHYVDLRPHHTAQVAEFSLDDLDYLFRLRALLMPEAVRWAHGKLSPDDFAGLRRDIEEMDRLLERGDLRATFAIYVERFLKRIYASTGSRLLVTILDRLQEETWRARYSRSERRGAVWLDDQRRLVDLLETGTPSAAAREIKRQIEQQRNELITARPSLD
jgi:DNA-binding GntR family transcriptional regulator